VTRGSVARHVTTIEDVADSITDVITGPRVVLESAHLFDKPVPHGISPQTFAWNPRHSSGHAILLAPVKAFAALTVDIPEHAALSPFSLREPGPLQNTFSIAFRQRPTWSFGSMSYSKGERESRGLLELKSNGVTVGPDIGQWIEADIGHVVVSFSAPTDIVLILDEAYVFTGLKKPQAGLVVIFARGTTQVGLNPTRQTPEFRNWGITAEAVDDTDAVGESWVSYLEASNVRGRLMFGQSERLIESDVNSLVISSKSDEEPGIHLQWDDNTLHAVCNAQSIARAELNGTNLFPSEWNGLSTEAHLSIIGAICTFLMGLMLTNKNAVARLFHWLFVFTPPASTDKSN
jgi:hypothetical protein